MQTWVCLQEMKKSGFIDKLLEVRKSKLFHKSKQMTFEAQ